MNRDELLVKVNEFAIDCIRLGVAKLAAVEICGHESPKERSLYAFKAAYRVCLKSKAGEETLSKLINEYDAELHVIQLEGLVIKALLRAFSLSLTDVTDIISCEEAWELLDENYGLKVVKNLELKPARQVIWRAGENDPGVTENMKTVIAGGTILCAREKDRGFFEYWIKPDFWNLRIEITDAAIFQSHLLTVDAVKIVKL